MGMTLLTPSFKASGTIAPNRFVKVSGAFQVAQCSVAGELPFGISQEGLATTPIPGATAGVAASAGDPVGVFGLGETALIQVASAVTAGAKLKTDTSGKAVATTTAGDVYGAIALEDQATVDGKVLAFFMPGKI